MAGFRRVFGIGAVPLIGRDRFSHSGGSVSVRDSIAGSCCQSGGPGVQRQQFQGPAADRLASSLITVWIALVQVIA
jgi:hypothetical protein